MYKRIMIKISGEALEDKENHLPYKTSFLERIETMVQEIRDLHTDVMIVVGGGNIFRGKIANSIGVDRATGDYMGMLATIMNAMFVNMKTFKICSALTSLAPIMKKLK